MDPKPERNVQVDELLAAMRRRRRWSFAIGLTPLATAGAVLGVMELGREDFAVPIGAVGVAALVIEVIAAIDAGLAINRAFARISDGK